MKLTVRGYPTLTLPAKLMRPMHSSFGSETPYIAKIASRCRSKSYIQTKLPSKLLCLEAVRDRAQALGGYKSYSDLLAGVGMSAHIFGGSKKYLNDFDPSCRQVLELNFPKAVVTGDDITVSKLYPADLVFADFNDFTMKRYLRGPYGQVVSGAAKAANRFLVVNDCSLFYFRYGASSFAAYSRLMGTDITTLEQYLAASAVIYKEQLDLHLVHAAYFREAAFLLLSRVEAEPIYRKVCVTPGMVRVEEDGTLFPS